jgi:hypothetical protein
MSAPTEDEFVSLLAGVDREAFARFLAALWTARGRPATVENGRVVVEGGPTLRPHAPRRRLPARLTARGIDPGSADAVVTTDPDVAALLADRGVAVVGPAALHQALLYDVDRAAANRIGREHLGRPFDVDPPPTVGERVRTVADRLAPVVLALAVLAAAGAGLTLLVTGAGSDGVAERTSPTHEP